MTTKYLRKNLIINDIYFQSLKDNSKIFFYEIYKISITGLPRLSPSIILYCRNGEKVDIDYGECKTLDEMSFFQNELNYLIQSVLED